MVRYLLVPGRGVPRPEHWMRRWADEHPEYQWAPYPPGSPFQLTDRVEALHAALAASEEPAVLVAHSAGCLATVASARRQAGGVRAALLVAPPYIDPQWKPRPGEVTDAAFGVVPREKLPFRTIVVASRTDPWASFAQSERYAEDWGAELFDAGDAGHIDTASGYGPWPAGEELLAGLA